MATDIFSMTVLVKNYIKILAMTHDSKHGRVGAVQIYNIPENRNPPA